MKNTYSITGCLALLMVWGLTGCLKKIDIINSNTVEVTFNNSGTKFVTSDITLNPKDSIFFDFTIKCPGNMKYVSIQKNGVDIVRDTLTVATRNLYSTVKKLMSDSIPGVYTYSVVAKDTGGIYLGSNGFKVTIAPDFIYYVDRRLYVPDTTAKTSKTYYSASTGNTYSYSEGAANSASIDFGYYYDTTSANKFTIYALTANPVSFYDVSSFTKNATVFKRITSPAFTAITSSAELQKQGVLALSSGALSKVSVANGATTPGTIVGNTYMFKTAQGKYGAIFVIYASLDSPAFGNYITVDVKIQK